MAAGRLVFRRVPPSLARQGMAHLRVEGGVKNIPRRAARWAQRQQEAPHEVALLQRANAHQIPRLAKRIRRTIVNKDVRFDGYRVKHTFQLWADIPNRKVLEIWTQFKTSPEMSHRDIFLAVIEKELTDRGASVVNGRWTLPKLKNVKRFIYTTEHGRTVIREVGLTE